MYSIVVDDLIKNGGDGLVEPQAILMFSGGKDSTYLLWYCLENDIQFDRVIFCDSTVEYPPIYDWLDYIEQRFKINILKIVPRQNFKELLYSKRKRGKFKGEIRGFPSTVDYCWVSRDLKFHKSVDKIWQNATRLIGICSDEMKRVTDLPDLPFPVRWPLVEAGITERQVIRELKQLDLYPPIYELIEKYTIGKSKPRTGCWICPKSSLASMRMLYNEFPELWEKLRTWEETTPLRWKMSQSVEEYERRFRGEDWRSQTRLVEVGE